MAEITIDVYVIVEYGVRIRTVAESVQHTVQFHVEKALGLPVRAVNVYIQGLRLEKEKEKSKAHKKQIVQDHAASARPFRRLLTNTLRHCHEEECK